MGEGTHRDEDTGSTIDRAMQSVSMSTVLVTVGTTSFDDLIGAVCSRPFLVEWARSAGGDDGAGLRLTLQFGNGAHPLSLLPADVLPAGAASSGAYPDDGSATAELPVDDRGLRREVRITWCRFDPALPDEMARSDAVLCHAGAGTLLEAADASDGRLRDGRGPIRTAAFVNTALMDNHQSELADELGRRGHVIVSRGCAGDLATVGGAARFWAGMGGFEPVPFAGGGAGGASPGRGGSGVSGFQRIVDRVMGFGSQDNKTK